MAKISDREEIAIQRLWELFEVSDEQQLQAFGECLGLIAQECGVSAGRLRPSDLLDDVMGEPQTHNPLVWLYQRASFEDRSSELSFRLKQQRKKIGVGSTLNRSVVSVRDYVVAWLGLDDQRGRLPTSS